MTLEFLIKLTVCFVVVATIFTTYEYLIRGSKVLLQNKNIELFPLSLHKIISKSFRKKIYSYNINKTKKIAILGIYFSGQFLVFLLALISIYIYIVNI